MARFEQLVLSDRRDQWGIPRRTDTAIINLDQLCTVRDATVDTTYRAFFDPACPRGVFPALDDGDRPATPLRCPAKPSAIYIA